MFRLGLFKGWPTLRSALELIDEYGVLATAHGTLYGDRCVLGSEGCKPRVYLGRPSGRHRYSCGCVYHEGKPHGNVGLVDAFAASVNGRLRPLAKEHYGLWALRMLKAGGIDFERDAGIGRIELPAAATQLERELYTDICELFEAKWYIWPFVPVPLARSFLRSWSNSDWSQPGDKRVSVEKREQRELARLRRTFEALENYGAITRSGASVKIGRRTCNLWVPGTLVPEKAKRELIEESLCVHA